MGIEAIPSHLVESLEDNAKGRTYISELADKLYRAHENPTIGRRPNFTGSSEPSEV